MAITVNGGANTIGGLAVGGIDTAEAVTANSIGNGGIIAVKQVVKSDQWSYNTIDTWVDIPGLSITHTLANSSNKLLLSYHINVSSKVGAYSMAVRMLDDATVIQTGGSDGSVTVASSGHWSAAYAENYSVLSNTFLYAPGNTDSNAYHMEAFTPYAEYIYVNRTSGWNNAYNEYIATPSTLTLMEVVA